MAGALDGIVVADFSRVLAGPYATMLMADLGAEVVKIERPETGDDTRSWGPPYVDDHHGAPMATYFASVNRNKSSVALDLSTDSGRDAARDIVARADVVVDTSDLNVHELRDRIVDLFGGGDDDRGMQTMVTSFGYKHGLPLDVDLVVDCRFLPNPHWVEELRPHTGKDTDVRDYVLRFPETGEFLDRLDSLLELLLPAYVAEGKSYLTIAMGCTGGRHRSVAIAESLAKFLKDRPGADVRVIHRDVDRKA